MFPKLTAPTIPVGRIPASPRNTVASPKELVELLPVGCMVKKPRDTIKFPTALWGGIPVDRTFSPIRDVPKVTLDAFPDGRSNSPDAGTPTVDPLTILDGRINSFVLGVPNVEVFCIPIGNRRFLPRTDATPKFAVDEIDDCPIWRFIFTKPTSEAGLILDGRACVPLNSVAVPKLREDVMSSG